LIKLGPAGTGEGTEEGLKKIKELGLDGVEIEFTYGVRMSNATAKQIGELAQKLKLQLSVHAPYYINLASEEIEKREASIRRILESCERGHYLTAKYIVFHAAFYGKMDKEEVYQIVKKSIIDMQAIIRQNEWNVLLAPETTGKGSQFGTLDELLRLHKETGCSLCVDFAHLLARHGSVDYEEILKKLEGLKEVHCHFSGIEYTEKGERKHLITEKAAIKKLFEKLLKSKTNFMIINESPDPIGDSLKSLEVLKEIE
jgi:deoxyribonuclease-4